MIKLDFHIVNLYKYSFTQKYNQLNRWVYLMNVLYFLDYITSELYIKGIQFLLYSLCTDQTQTITIHIRKPL